MVLGAEEDDIGREDPVSVVVGSNDAVVRAGVAQHVAGQGGDAADGRLLPNGGKNKRL